DIFLSTDGGGTFGLIAQINGTDMTSGIDQPTIVTGPAHDGVHSAVWVSFQDAGTTQLAVAGAPVFGKGRVGAFSSLFLVPSSPDGNFGDIAVGPQGQVMVAFQHDTSGVGPDTIDVSVKTDGFGPGTFSSPVTATPTNIGGFDPILAQPNRTVDAEAGLAWDRSGRPHTRPGHLPDTDAPSVAVNDTRTDLFVRFSDNMGQTWSSPLKVNDDASSLHFLPKIALDQTTGNIGVSWYDTRNDPTNTKPEFFASFSVNGGRCFLPNAQTPTSPSNATPDQNAGFDYGDFTGATFQSGVFHPAWADNSAALGSANPDGQFEIATAALTVPAFNEPEDAFEANDTSDQAHNFGVLTAGPSAVQVGLTISNHANGLPDYDWFRWEAPTAGVFAATALVDTTFGDLEVHLFTVNQNNTLVELTSSSSVTAPTCTAVVSVGTPVRAGQVVLVEVKGVNSRFGVHDIGRYDLTWNFQ